MSFLNKRSIQWLSLGALLSTGAPIGLWILITFLKPEPSDLLSLVFLYSGIATFIAFSLFGYFTGRLIQKNEDLSNHDALTGLFNRRYFFKRFEEYLSLSQRYMNPISLLILDLDHFKKVNDQHGHLVGDQTLRSMSTVVEDECRGTDISARIGGEEFVILCPNTDKSEAFLLAERLRHQVANLSPEQLGYPGPQTVSIGVVSPESAIEYQAESLLLKADELLYKAKEQGRNKVVLE